MSDFTQAIQLFFTSHLSDEKSASPNTIRSYRDTIRLLVAYLAGHGGPAPALLDFPDAGCEKIAAFLTWLETERGNSPASRNQRLAAIRSLFTFASYRYPQHADLIARVLAIGPKRGQKNTVCFLTKQEADALMAAPGNQTWHQRRDTVLLHVAIQTGLRVSELTSLRLPDLRLGPSPHLHCLGKGRKLRDVPLTRPAARLLAAWAKALPPAASPGDDRYVFPTLDGHRLSTDAVAKLLAKHVTAAAARCPSIGTKNVTPHTLRHTCAMRLREAGVDLTVIAIWLGHASTQTTEIYLHADMTIKRAALDRLDPTPTKPGRYQPTDQLLAFLNQM